MRRTVWLILLMCPLHTSCATLFHGSTDTVEINSARPGIEVFVDGVSHATPTRVNLASSQRHLIRGPDGATLLITPNLNPLALIDLQLVLPFVVNVVFDSNYVLGTTELYVEESGIVRPIRR